ncbi:MAG TPA: helix-turn-helix domain-containing protein [Microlunatus sp.]|nr:helix-turn-helix domain-containing protein [Microlunatus sp.]
MRAEDLDQAKTKDRPLLRSLIGGALRLVRQKQGRTLADVAEAAGVSVPYLSEIERGRKEPSSEVLGAVCDALRIELVELVALVGRELVARRSSRVVVPLAERRRLRRPAVPAEEDRPLEVPQPITPRRIRGDRARRRGTGGDVTCLLQAA